MDRTFAPGAEAQLRYHHGEFKIIRQGTHVHCAVSRMPIPIEDLKYWSVELQEAYAGPEQALQRLRDLKAPSVTFSD